MISPPSYVRIALSRLESAGFSAFCVGGCVRDSLLGKNPNDWDVATSALPDETLACFPEYQTITYGKKHGTVSVIIGGNPVEITTFRCDGEYTDCRRPACVAFTADLASDLSRRDFTVNAMAWNAKTGLVDLFNGQKDLRDNCLRCVGNAHVRFSEDALRILRCARFSAQLGFTAAPETAGAAMLLAPALRHISAERTAAELSLLLCGSFAEATLRSYAEIVFVCLPLLQPMKNCLQETPYHIYDVWEHTLHAIGLSPATLLVRLALLFHDSGKPGTKTMTEQGPAHFYGHAAGSEQIARVCMTQLRLPNRLITDVCSLVRLHDQILPLKKLKIKRLLGELGRENFFALLEVMHADISAQASFLIPQRLETLLQTRRQAQQMLDSGVCLQLSDLAVTGTDLIALGFSPGKKLGDTLQDLFQLVFLEQVENDRERLLQIARRRSKAENKRPLQ